MITLLSTTLADLVSFVIVNSDKFFIKKMKCKIIIRLCFSLNEFKNYLKDVEQKTEVKKAYGIIRRILILIL